jgi:Mg2+-importing ATPase
VLGFDPLPVPFFLALLGMTVVYLVLVETAKHWFFSRAAQQPAVAEPAAARRRDPIHHISRRAARFSAPVPGPLLINHGPGQRRRRKTGHKGPRPATVSGG